MKTKLFFSKLHITPLVLSVFLLNQFVVFAQTNPTPHNLGTSNFSFTGFTSGTTSTYPSSMQGWGFSTEQTTATTSNATSDKPMLINSTSASTGSIRNEIASGVSILNSTGNGWGAIAIAINTINRQNVKVTWTAAEVGANGSRSNALVLQYRVGTSAPWNTISGSTYTTNVAQTNTPAQTFTNIALPPDADNQSVVQLRWLYYYVSGTGSRDRIRLDEITISSLGIQTITNFDAIPVKTFGDAPFTVSATGGASGNPVVFTSSDPNVATCTGTNGTTITIINAGSCTINANQSGNSSYAPASQVSQQLVINKSSQSITFNALSDKVYGDAPFTISAAGGSSGNPVFFTSSDNNIVTCTGTNGEIITITGAGICTIYANQDGNNNFESALQANQSLTVNKASQTITFNTLPTKMFGDALFTLSATGGASGNPVTFTSSNNSVAMCTGTNGSSCVITGVGSCTITASQAGNNNFENATDVIQTLTVKPQAYDVTFFVTDGSNPIPGATVTFNSLSQTTDPSGYTTFTEVLTGNSLFYNVSYTGFNTLTENLNLINQNIIEDVTLNNSTNVTQLTVNSCGLTTYSNSTTVYCNKISGATAYEFEFTNSTLNFTQTLSNPTGSSRSYIKLSSIAGIQYGYIYDVRVRALNGGQWGSFYSVCQVSLQIGTTQLRTEYCGYSTTKSSDNIWCNNVPEASAYEFNFVNSSLGMNTTLSNPYGQQYPYVRLSSVSGIQYGYSYDVKVRAKVNGVWGDWGTTCQVNLSVGTTQLRTAYCGLSTSDAQALIWCDNVLGSEGYEFEFANTTIGLIDTVSNIFNPSLQYMRLSYVPGIQRGYTYYVRVRVKLSGQWGEFGPVCQVTLNNTKSLFNENDTEMLSSLNIYPNPVSEMLTIEFKSEYSGSYIMEVTDITGRLILQEEGYIETTGYTGQKDVSEWENGIYILHVLIDNEWQTQRFIKQ